MQALWEALHRGKVIHVQRVAALRDLISAA